MAGRAQSAGSPRRGPRGSTAESLCPICLGDLRHALETNCGHIFCADCLFTHCDHGNPLNPMNCPLCRQHVTLLFACFSDSELNSAGPDSVTARMEARKNVGRYNRRFSGQPRALMEYVWDLPCLLRHLWLEFFSEGGLFLMFRLRVVMCFVAALMYLLSPLDIVPEAAFGVLGLLDDLFIFVLILLYVSVIYRRYVVARD